MAVPGRLGVRCGVGGGGLRGSLGLPGTPEYRVPTAVFSDASVAGLAIGRFSTCVMRQNPFRVWCSGLNGSRQFRDDGKNVFSWTLVADESTKGAQR